MGSAARRVLIVEDDEDIRESLADAVGRAGYQVTTACHGGEALDSVGIEAPDVVVLDLMMPIVDGWEVMRQLEEQGRSIAVLVVTAQRAPVLPAGVQHLTKPVTRRTLLAAIEGKLPVSGPDVVLYVADGCARSAYAIKMLSAVLRGFGPEEVVCEIRNIATADAEQLRADRVVVTPTLIVRRPLPLRFVGGIASPRHLTTLLDLADRRHR
jgi:CheY-like chemotaxis protein